MHTHPLAIVLAVFAASLVGALLGDLLFFFYILQ